MSKSWDNNVLKKLKTLLDKGLSTAEIGKKLGMSKNAIIGKLHRLGWNAGVGDEDKKTSDKSESAKKSAVKKAPAKKETAKKPAVKKVEAPKKVVAVADKKKKVAPKATTKAKTVVKPLAPKKEKDEPKKKVVGRAITGRTNNVHQRIVQHALEMANLKPNQCRWPIGDPDSEGFHFCGAPVFVGKPYCYEHCKQAYQFSPPKKK